MTCSRPIRRLSPLRHAPPSFGADEPISHIRHILPSNHLPRIPLQHRPLFENAHPSASSFGRGGWQQEHRPDRPWGFCTAWSARVSLRPCAPLQWGESMNKVPSCNILFRFPRSLPWTTPPSCDVVFLGLLREKDKSTL